MGLLLRAPPRMVLAAFFIDFGMEIVDPRRMKMKSDAIAVGQIFVMAGKYLACPDDTLDRAWGVSLFHMACCLLETVRDPIDYLRLYSLSLRMVETHLLPEG